MSIFSNTPIQGEVWDMSGAVLFFGNSNATRQEPPSSFDQPGAANTIANYTLIATNLTLQYTRQISKRYPINFRRAIYMVGQPTGVLQIGALFGPTNTLGAFLKTFSGIGGVQNETHTAITIIPYGTRGAGTATGSGNLFLGSWKISDPVLSGVGLTIAETGQSQIPVTANISMEFHDLEVDGDTKVENKPTGNPSSSTGNPQSMLDLMAPSNYEKGGFA